MLYEEQFRENLSLFVVFVSDAKKISWARMSETDKLNFNRGDKKSIIARYMPNEIIDRPYTLVIVSSPEEVETKLLEQYSSLSSFVSRYSKVI